MLLVLSISEIGRLLAGTQIFLILISMSIPFAIKNSKVVGILLIIVPTISFGISVKFGLDLTSTGISQIAGFILFLIGGIMALFHKEEENKKKRKAFTIILGFLDKINTVKEWNDRLHDLQRKLGPYEDILSTGIRRAIDTVSRDTDLEELSKLVYEERSEISWKPASRIIKFGTAMLFAVLSLGFGVFAYGNFVGFPSHVSIPGPVSIPGSFSIPGLVSFQPGECSQGEHLENGACISDKNLHSSGYSNNILVANSGKDQIVDEGKEVVLDGGMSHNSNGDSLKYFWKKVKGPSISLVNDNEKMTKFTAPQVTKDTPVIILLTVSDQKSKASDKVKVTINNVVTDGIPSTPDRIAPPPTVEASAEPASVSYTDCNQHQTVKLDAKGNNGQPPLSYKWQQIHGDKVKFQGGDDTPNVTFQPTCKEQKLSFRVTVQDTNKATGNDEISVGVSVVPSVGSSIKKMPPPSENELIKIPPTVEASSKPRSIIYKGCLGSDKLQTLRLQADGKDTDGNIVSYKWEQTAPEQNNIGKGDQSSVLFKAPCTEETLSFTITVEDNDGATAKAKVDVPIHVLPIPDVDSSTAPAPGPFQDPDSSTAPAPTQVP